ncbi:flagellin [Rhodopila sp.]|uniref:flagellin n=1 Tax=Rhodopila sp. TaxID=2480087 RepID=UPI003D0EA0CE
MTLNSVNTNMGAMVALQSLESTQAQLTATQKQISTGYRVSDSTDDGATYAIAQGIRSTVGALTTANQQLGSVQGLLSTTQSGLNNVSNTMASMRDVLQNMSGPNVTGSERTNYETTYNSLLSQVKGFIQDAGYNGKTLVGNIAGSTGSFGRTAVVRNDSGATYGLATFGGAAMFGSISFTGTQLGGASTVAAMVTAGGVFMKQMNAVNNELNVVGNSINYINNETTYNSNKIDALNSGLGSLIDADLAKESAQLTALQIRQQLGTQSLSMANQAPQTLLSLFK